MQSQNKSVSSTETETEIETENQKKREMFKTGIHRASSQSWGDSSCARLCGIIVESNTGIAQQVLENRTDLLDLYSKAELLQPDDLGISITFLAVYFDQPDILNYLKKRGVDLSAPCDPMSFGNPMFYALRLGKHRLIRVLDLLGCSVNNPCNDLKEKPVDIARRLNDQIAQDEIVMAQTKEIRAATLFRKNFLKLKYRKDYEFTLRMVLRLQKVIRGMLGRRRIRLMTEEGGGKRKKKKKLQSKPST